MTVTKPGERSVESGLGAPSLGDDLGLDFDLTARETELLGQAGERVFQLARRLSATEKEVERIRTELALRDELLAETRRSRDVLGAQVQSLLQERERDYEERQEMRSLFMTTQVQLQAILEKMTVPAPAPASLPPAAVKKAAPGAGQRRRKPGFLAQARREIGNLIGG